MDILSNDGEYSEIQNYSSFYPSGSLLSWSQNPLMLSQSLSLFKGLVALSVEKEKQGLNEIPILDTPSPKPVLYQ